MNDKGKQTYTLNILQSYGFYEEHKDRFKRLVKALNEIFIKCNFNFDLHLPERELPSGLGTQ